MEKQLYNIQYYKFSAYGFLRNLMFFDSFLLLFLIENGISFTQIGVLYAVREIVVNILEIPSGIIADTWGRKRALASSFVAYIMSFVVFYFSTNYLLYMLAFGLFGFAEAFRSGTHKGMMMDYLKLKGWQDHKTNYYGHTRSWSQRGLAVSSIVAGAIVFYQGDYRSIFIYSVIPYLLNLTLLFTYPMYLDKPKNSKSGSIQITSTFRDFIVVIRKPKVLGVITNTALHTAFLKSIKDYIQPVMVAFIAFIPLLNGVEEKQKNGFFIGILYFIIYQLTAKASQLSGRVKNNKRKITVYIFLIIGLLSGCFVGFFYMLEYWWISIIAFAFIFIVENIRKPIMTGLVVDIVPTDILTTVLSVQSQFKTIITVVLVLCVGVFADIYGVGISLLIVSSVLLLILIILKSLFHIKSNTH